MRPAVILADFGTSNSKWSLLIRDADNALRLEPSVSEPAESERPLDDGLCVWNPTHFIGRMVHIVMAAHHRANQLGSRVVGICCTGTASSVVAVNGRAIVSEIPAIRWDDQSATGEAALLESLRREHKACEWLTFGADSALSRFLWLAARYPNQLTPGTSILEQLDLLTLFWTDQRVLSESIAARKWGFSASHPWPDDFSRAVSGLPGNHGKFLDACLPKRTVEAGTAIGRIRSAAADQFGLPRQTQVIAAPYDTVAQVLGLGLLHQDAAAAVSLGTSMGVCSLVRRLGTEFSTRGPIPDVPFRRHALFFDGLRSCGSAIDLVCVMVFGAKTDESTYHERIAACIRDTQPGSDDVLVLPYFSGGLRSGGYSQPVISGFRDTKQKQLVRAVFEALAYHIRLIVEHLEQSMPASLERILTGGGPSKNREFMQMVADVTNREVRVARFPDSGLLGCAICAAAGLEWFDNACAASRALSAQSEVFRPRREYASTYESLYRMYRSHLDRLGGAVIGGPDGIG